MKMIEVLRLSIGRSLFLEKCISAIAYMRKLQHLLFQNGSTHRLRTRLIVL